MCLTDGVPGVLDLFTSDIALSQEATFARELCLTMLHCVLDPLRHSGHYMHRQFNMHKVYILPTQCVYVYLSLVVTKKQGKRFIGVLALVKNNYVNLKN